jgi:hypothetical protein
MSPVPQHGIGSWFLVTACSMIVAYVHAGGPEHSRRSAVSRETPVTLMRLEIMAKARLVRVKNKYMQAHAWFNSKLATQLQVERDFWTVVYSSNEDRKRIWQEAWQKANEEKACAIEQLIEISNKYKAAWDEYCALCSDNLESNPMPFDGLGDQQFGDCQS